MRNWWRRTWVPARHHLIRILLQVGHLAMEAQFLLPRSPQYTLKKAMATQVKSNKVSPPAPQVVKVKVNITSYKQFFSCRVFLILFCRGNYGGGLILGEK